MKTEQQFLTEWLTEHTVAQHKEMLRYNTGPAEHLERAKAHARAAAALQREVDER